MKKSICVLVNDPYSGFNGSYLQALKLVKNLVEKGESVYILACRYSPDVYWDLTECEIDGVHLFYLDSKFFSKYKLLSYCIVLFALLKLKKITSIVQIITSGYIFPVIIYKFLSNGIVILVTTSDRFKTKGSSFNLVGKFKLKLISNVDKIIVKSDSLFNKYSKLINPIKLKKIKNGVDTVLYSPASDNVVTKIKEKFNINANSIVILFVGNILKDKGVKELVDAFIAEVKTKSYKLVLVGDETLEPVYVETLRNTIIRKGYQAQIQFIPPLTEIHQLYQIANAFILPSRREGFPNVVLEAMATGIPCYVTKLSYVSDIKNILTYVFEIGDENTALRQIITNCSNGINNQKIEESIQYIEQNYSQSRVVDSYIELYRMLGHSIITDDIDKQPEKSKIF
ncbi:MAG: glycosyltransferase family 4 protein [Saccharospirillaceae bacterium]|nr:glycosyltransferase family 4 protein [Saccharospirillaceae bacterium]